MQIVIINDVWESIEKGRENLLYQSYLLNPYINYVLGLLRKQNYQIIHHPDAAAEWYNDWPQRQKVKELLGHKLVEEHYDGQGIKQSDQIDIFDNDLIVNSNPEIISLLPMLDCEEVTIVGYHLDVCIEDLIKYLHKIPIYNIRIVANCTLPFRDKNLFVGFDDKLDYLRNTYSVSIVHL